VCTREPSERGVKNYRANGQKKTGDSYTRTIEGGLYLAVKLDMYSAQIIE
jgi:hypothetical protein